MANNILLILLAGSLLLLGVTLLTFFIRGRFYLELTCRQAGNAFYYADTFDMGANPPGLLFIGGITVAFTIAFWEKAAESLNSFIYFTNNHIKLFYLYNAKNKYSGKSLKNHPIVVK
jgi:hypothetical protein